MRDEKGGRSEDRGQRREREGERERERRAETYTIPAVVLLKTIRTQVERDIASLWHIVQIAIKHQSEYTTEKKR